MDPTYEESEDGDHEQVEVESSVVSGSSTRRSSITTPIPVNGHTNGVAKPIPPPIDYEIPRKLLHSSIGASVSVPCERTVFANPWSGFLTLYLYLGEGDARKVVLALWSALCIIYPADLLRFRSRRFAALYERMLGFLMRDSEKVRFRVVLI